MKLKDFTEAMLDEQKIQFRGEVPVGKTVVNPNIGMLKGHSGYEFWVGADKKFYVKDNDENKITATLENAQEFMAWLKKSFPRKSPQELQIVIAQLNKTGKFSEKEDPADLTKMFEVQ